MDIAEDSFYFARQDLIQKRLSEIENGQGPVILAKFDEMHREQGTMCVGVRWDLFQRQDLVEIAQVRRETFIILDLTLIARIVHRRETAVGNLPTPL